MKNNLSNEGKRFLLDLNKLEIGDVVLESGDTKLISPLIKRVTQSNFSHAMLYTGHSIIHATGEGVFSKNPQRILVSRPDGLKVLRYNGTLQELSLSSVCNYAKSKVGCLYSKREAAKSVFKKDCETDNKRQFCSRLVAQSYSEAGIEIVENHNFCTPEDINKSPHLTEVTGCVVPATQADIEMSEKPDPNIENQTETFKWLKLARDNFKSDDEIQTIEDVVKYILSNKASDKKLCAFINQTKYLNIYDVDRGINQYRYDNELFEKKLIYTENHDNFLESEISLNKREVERHLKSFLSYRDLYKKTRMVFFKLHVKLYRNLLDESITRLRVISNYRAMPTSKQKIVDELINNAESILKPNIKKHTAL